MGVWLSVETQAWRRWQQQVEQGRASAYPMRPLGEQQHLKGMGWQEHPSGARTRRHQAHPDTCLLPCGHLCLASQGRSSMAASVLPHFSSSLTLPLQHRARGPAVAPSVPHFGTCPHPDANACLALVPSVCTTPSACASVSFPRVLPAPTSWSRNAKMLWKPALQAHFS